MVSYIIRGGEFSYSFFNFNTIMRIFFELSSTYAFNCQCQIQDVYVGTRSKMGRRYNTRMLCFLLGLNNNGNIVFSSWLDDILYEDVECLFLA